MVTTIATSYPGTVFFGTPPTTVNSIVDAAIAIVAHIKSEGLIHVLGARPSWGIVNDLNCFELS